LVRNKATGYEILLVRMVQTKLWYTVIPNGWSFKTDHNYLCCHWHIVFSCGHPFKHWSRPMLLLVLTLWLSFLYSFSVAYI